MLVLEGAFEFPHGGRELVDRLDPAPDAVMAAFVDSSHIRTTMSSTPL
jgi:hypothetical protein